MAFAMDFLSITFLSSLQITVLLLNTCGFHLTPDTMKSKCSGLKFGTSDSSSYASNLHSMRLLRLSLTEIGASLFSDNNCFLLILKME